MPKHELYEGLIDLLEGAEFIQWSPEDIDSMYLMTGSDETELYLVMKVKIGDTLHDFCFHACRGWRFTGNCYHIDKVSLEPGDPGPIGTYQRKL